MLGSLTTPSRTAPRVIAAARVAFRLGNAVGTRDKSAFAAQWPACTLPCRRFAVSLTEADARLGPVWVATPSLWRTSTSYSLPVSRRTTSSPKD